MSSRPEPPRVLVVGESLIDRVRAPDGTSTSHVGGSPANVAVGLARLGMPVDFLTRFGEDADGRRIRDHLRRNGVQVLTGPGAAPTSVAEASIDPAGAASYRFALSWDLDPRSAAAARAGESRCVHTGSLATALEPGAAAVRALLSGARSRATISYDPNCRPSIVGDRAAARAEVERWVRLADVVKASEDDLRWLYPDRADRAVAADWLRLGPGLVVITRGADGAWALTAAGAITRPAPRVRIADTVGAGDSFTAALIAGLHDRDLLGAARRADLHAIHPGTVGDLLAEAALAAAITCTRPGADPPTRPDLDAAVAPASARNGGTHRR